MGICVYVALTAINKLNILLVWSNNNLTPVYPPFYLQNVLILRREMGVCPGSSSNVSPGLIFRKPTFHSNLKLKSHSL